jgi:hypothetical protein
VCRTATPVTPHFAHFQGDPRWHRRCSSDGHASFWLSFAEENTMKKYTLFTLPLLALVACASSEEYEVTGEITSATMVSGPIDVSFYEVDKVDAAAERTLIKEVQIAQVGAFTDTIDVADGNKVIVLALVDGDGDGKCTEGELWAEAEATPTEDGKLPKVTLALAASACPAEAPAP